MSIKIIGISAYYHDSAAVLLIDGKIAAAVQEERFSRIKHDARFPVNALKYCLEQYQLVIEDIDFLVYYEKPFIKFERLLETYLTYAPRGLKSFLQAMPVWIKEKLFIKKTLAKELQKLSSQTGEKPPCLMFTDHHQSHAGSAFFPSPFKSAAILCLDGVGEWTTTSVWQGDGNQLTPLWDIKFPHSLGLLYSSFTYYTGFKVNSGEYKLMGLAPYGEPKYVKKIKDNLIDIKKDGTFRLNLDYFNYTTGLTMTGKKFEKLFNGPVRKPETIITQKEMDMAKSIQFVTQEIVLKLARTIKKETHQKNLCLAGGVALNCVANGALEKEGVFEKIWIQPASGDAGGALGSALSIWYEYLENSRFCDGDSDQMRGAYLGPEFSEERIKLFLDSQSAIYEKLNNDILFKKTARLLEKGHVVGWFQGKMEFGPRALGNRSILGDPRNTKMQSLMNLKIKYRESFRPFAPAVKSDKAGEWFEAGKSNPYMLVVSNVVKDKRTKAGKSDQTLTGFEKLKLERSKIPAVTHVDFSARTQTVYKENNLKFYKLIDAFEKQTNCPILVNTSFNVRGEPIVCSPEDAFNCFMQTQMDFLVMGNIFLEKNKQDTKKLNSPLINQYSLD